MIEYLTPLYTMLTSRWAGGGLDAEEVPGWLPELFFACAFAAPLAFILTGWWLLLLPLIVAWSFLWMQSGTGPGLGYGMYEGQPTRPRTLSPFVDWVARTLNIPYRGIWYCRIWMAVKGFLIGLPVGGLPLAILWPLGYEIGYRLYWAGVLPKANLRELLAGFGAGLSILLFWKLAPWLLT